MFLFLSDLMTGINTKAPEISIMTMSGPSILGVEVRTRKHKAAQQRVRTTHWVWLSGFLIVVSWEKGYTEEQAGKGNMSGFLASVPPCGFNEL